MDCTNKWLKLLIGEDAEANDDSNDKDDGSGSSEDNQEKHSDWGGDEDCKEDDSDCNGDEDLLEGEVTRKNNMNRRRKICSNQRSIWIPSIQRILCIQSTTIMSKLSLSLIGKDTVHLLHAQSILSGMESPSSCQIGTKMNTSKMNRVRTSANFVQVLQSTDVRM